MRRRRPIREKLKFTGGYCLNDLLLQRRARFHALNTENFYPVTPFAYVKYAFFFFCTLIAFRFTRENGRSCFTGNPIV